MRPVPGGAAAHILVSFDRLAATCADLAVRVSRVIVTVSLDGDLAGPPRSRVHDIFMSRR